MWKRHAQLAERERCGATWSPKKFVHPEDHAHSCKVFKGHVGHHACACGSGTPREDVSGLRLGART
jgi:hypothetical protein